MSQLQKGGLKTKYLFPQTDNFFKAEILPSQKFLQVNILLTDKHF
jgi:hypothetical protein